MRSESSANVASNKIVGFVNDTQCAAGRLTLLFHKRWYVHRKSLNQSSTDSIVTISFTS